MLHISNHQTSNLRIPDCLDQPFICYHAIKNNLYNNKKLVNIVINNPNDTDEWRPKHINHNYNGQTICHFSGGIGHYESKIKKMTKFMNDIMFNVNKNDSLKKISINDYNNILDNNIKYKWGKSHITFLENGKVEGFINGTYNFLDKYLVKCNFDGREHLLKFNQDYSQFISIRKYDFEI